MASVFTQWKLSGSSIVASSAAVKVDGSFVQGQAQNQSGTPQTGAALTLGATGLFWGALQPSGTPTMVTALTSTTSDAGVPTAAYIPSTNANPGPPIRVGIGAHTVTLQAAAGNATTVVNFRERNIVAVGA